MARSSWLELFLGQLPRCRRRLNALPDRLDPKRGVGNLAGNPQLDATNLRAVLLQLQPGPFVRGPVRASTQRIGHLQLDVPDWVVGVGDALERIPVAPRDFTASTSEDVLEAVPGRNPPGTALTVQLVAPRQVERRQGAVAEIVDGSLVGVELASRAGLEETSVRRSSAPRIASCRSIGASIRGWSVGFGSEFHNSSEMPSTMSSEERRGSTASASNWRRAAASDCACPTSIGALVPTSTRNRLSCTSCSASASACRCAPTAARARAEQRLAHHEPVFARPLREDHDRILKVTGAGSRLTCGRGSSSSSLGPWLLDAADGVTGIDFWRPLRGRGSDAP